MKQFKLGLIATAMTVLVMGCASGLVYTHTWQPLTLDMHKTPVSSTEASGDIKHIALGAASVAWGSAAIGDVAKKHSIQELYFADVETFSVLHIWNQYTVHVYGK